MIFRSFLSFSTYLLLVFSFLSSETFTPVHQVVGLSLPPNEVYSKKNPDENRQPLETCITPNGMAFIELFPNDLNCSSFFHCTEVSPGHPAPTMTVCPFYTNSKGERQLLSYNFYDCKCDYPEVTECYHFDTHYKHRYDCAKPLNTSVHL